jgi:peptidoglycan hydrolase-like protein with peptidoglycan-binding domain
MSRAGNVVRGAIALLVVGAAVIGAVLGLRALTEDDDNVTVAAEISTASAGVNTLTETLEASGTIGYEASVAVESPLSGTVLEIVEPGDTVSSGDVLARIDDAVIVWLAGEGPAWRSLTVGDEGDDVEQLERALTDLGFNDADVTVDDEYTTATADMVESWQASLDVEPTGDVELGTVVYTGERTRAATVSAGVGDHVLTGPLLSLGTADRVATFDVAPGDGVHLAVGDIVEVMLPDRTVVQSTVSSIREGVDVWTVSSILDEVELPERDTIAIDVSWDRVVAADVLTIPSSALLRLDGGSYVVDIVGVDGEFDRRRVDIGISIGTRTEIISGLVAGDDVVVL